MRQRTIDYGLVLAAGVLYAVALKYFVLPSKVILTGTEGIAAALPYYFESHWLFIGIYVLFQAVLLTFAFKRVSKTFAVRFTSVRTRQTVHGFGLVKYVPSRDARCFHAREARRAAFVALYFELHTDRSIKRNARLQPR